MALNAKIKDTERDLEQANAKIKRSRERHQEKRRQAKQAGNKLGNLREAVDEARDDRDENRKSLVVVRDRLMVIEDEGVSEEEVGKHEALTERLENLVDENEELTAFVRRTLPRANDLAETRAEKAELAKRYGEELENALKNRETNREQLEDLKKRKKKKKESKSNIGSDYFVASEFNCHAGGPVPDYMYDDLADLCDRVLDKMRAKFGPAHVNSGHRWSWYNVQIGGASLSFHVYEQRKNDPAADMTFANGSPAQWAAYARSLGVGGVGQYSTFCHVDTGPRRDWWG